MKKVFLSHAGKDAPLASRIADDLQAVGHEIVIDTKQLQIGDNLIDFINSALEECDAVIALISPNTPEATWQKREIEAATHCDVQGESELLIVRVDNANIPPLLRPTIFGDLKSASESSYADIIRLLCKKLAPSQTAASVVAEAFGASSSSPFRRIRAEYFEESPELLAKTFAPPDERTTGALEEMFPCLLEGSRGTGKTMLLLSLRARNFLARPRNHSKMTSVFGFYLKLTRGALCNATSEHITDWLATFTAQDRLALTDLSSQEIFLNMLESLFAELHYCLGKKHLECSRDALESLASRLSRRLIPGTPPRTCRDFYEILDSLRDIHRSLAEYMRRRFFYMETVTVPVANHDLDCFKSVIEDLRTAVPGLATVQFTVLLDEYENLFPYQQKIVNGVLKLAAPHFTIKIAKKIGAGETCATTTGQDIQETHDYTRIPLIYDVSDQGGQLNAYRSLLVTFVQNTLRGEGYCFEGIDQMLPGVAQAEVSDEILAEIALMCDTNPADFRALPESQRNERVTRFREAAEYRVVYGRSGGKRRKLFAGFDSLMLLSSGVIRYFQEFLGVAWHKAYHVSPPNDLPIVFEPQIQSSAVYLVSQYNLSTLSRNVANDGDCLKRFLIDLGGLLADKLRSHRSEPEGGRLTISDPEKLELPEYKMLKQILIVGNREGVVQSNERGVGYKPKNKSAPQPYEFNICRLLAPVLQFSPKLRWRTALTCKALNDLLLPETRKKAKTDLKKLLMKSESSPGITLYDKEDGL